MPYYLKQTNDEGAVWWTKKGPDMFKTNSEYGNTQKFEEALAIPTLEEAVALIAKILPTASNNGHGIWWWFEIVEVTITKVFSTQGIPE